VASNSAHSRASGNPGNTGSPLSRGRADPGCREANSPLTAPRTRSTPSPACGGGVGRGCARTHECCRMPPPCPPPVNGGGDAGAARVLCEVSAPSLRRESTRLCPAMTGWEALASLRRARRRKGNRLDLGQVELAGGMTDVEPNDFAVGIEVDDETRDDLSGLRARRALEFDIKAVRLRIVVQLHRSCSRKLRSKNALWTVSPSSSVTTRRKRGRVSPGIPRSE